MRTPNVQLVRAELPHGSIKKIGDKLGIPLKVVSEYFNNGWHQQYSNAILAEAMAIIRDKYPDQELLDEYEELGLSQGGSYEKPRKVRSVVAKRNTGTTLTWLLGIAGIVVGAYFVLPEVKQFIDEKIFGGGKKLTPEEELTAAVKAGAAAGGTSKK
jgi:hypothetical protein